MSDPGFGRDWEEELRAQRRENLLAVAFLIAAATVALAWILVQFA
jgi:hypothetical protein